MFDKNALMPVDVNYLYDGSLAGFYCCVHASVYGRELPQGIYPEAAAPQTLFPMKFIAADQDQAARVRASIPAKISPNASRDGGVFLSCLAAKERKLLDYCCLGIRRQAPGPMLGREAVAPGFAGPVQGLLAGAAPPAVFTACGLRGALVSVISPRILCSLPGAALRQPVRDENFMIYRQGRHLALTASKDGAGARGGWCSAPAGAGSGLPGAVKRFYDAWHPGRENPAAHTHLPKRYWDKLGGTSSQL